MPTLAWASEQARAHGLHLVAGSFVERDGDRLFNTSCLVGPDGELVASYRKVHLFDVGVPGAETRESDTFSPGPGPVVAPLGDGGPGLGLTVCYDLRFPELYRIEALMGASIVTVPAAFTRATGEPHWELLLRARAVEDQVAVVAAAQWGTSPDGIAPPRSRPRGRPVGTGAGRRRARGRRSGGRGARPRRGRRAAGAAAEPRQPAAPGLPLARLGRPLDPVVGDRPRERRVEVVGRQRGVGRVEAEHPPELRDGQVVDDGVALGRVEEARRCSRPRRA